MGELDVEGKEGVLSWSLIWKTWSSRGARWALRLETLCCEPGDLVRSSSERIERMIGACTCDSNTICGTLVYQLLAAARADARTVRMRSVPSTHHLSTNPHILNPQR